MRLDFQHNPALAKRYAVVDRETNEQVENVAWADAEVGEYGVYVTRTKTLQDRNDVDLRLRDTGGKLKVKNCQGDIEIVDLQESPWREDALLLLDDPEVRAKLRRLIIEALDGLRPLS